MLENLQHRVEKLANLTKRDFSFYENILLEHVADLEDIYDAEQCLIDIQTGKEKTISLEEYKAKYDLED